MGQNRCSTDRRSKPRPGSRDRRGGKRVRRLISRATTARRRKARAEWKKARNERIKNGFNPRF